MAYPLCPTSSTHLQCVQLSKPEVCADRGERQRAIHLGITHYTAKLVKDKVGISCRSMRFSMDSLTNHPCRNAFDPALGLTYVKDNEMARRVVQALFMVSNLLEKHQTFPPTVETLPSSHGRGGHQQNGVQERFERCWSA